MIVVRRAPYRHDSQEEFSYNSTPRLRSSEPARRRGTTRSSCTNSTRTSTSAEPALWQCCGEQIAIVVLHPFEEGNNDENSFPELLHRYEYNTRMHSLSLELEGVPTPSIHSTLQFSTVLDKSL